MSGSFARVGDILECHHCNAPWAKAVMNVEPASYVRCDQWESLQGQTFIPKHKMICVKCGKHLLPNKMKVRRMDEKIHHERS